MSSQDTLHPIAVLTPVQPESESALADHLTSMREQPSPFEGVAGTHLARLVILGQVPARPFIPVARRPLQMRYLLLTAVSDHPAPVFLEGLRTASGPAVDAVWQHCIRYPGHANADLFLGYMLRNMIDAHQTFWAYTATVSQIRSALALRRQHRAFALDADTMRGDDLQQAFLDHFKIARGAH